jgi:hypothetical protein
MFKIRGCFLAQVTLSYDFTCGATLHIHTHVCLMSKYALSSATPLQLKIHAFFSSVPAYQPVSVNEIEIKQQQHITLL